MCCRRGCGKVGSEGECLCSAGRSDGDEVFLNTLSAYMSVTYAHAWGTSSGLLPTQDSQKSHHNVLHSSRGTQTSQFNVFSSSGVSSTRWTRVDVIVKSDILNDKSLFSFK